MFSARRAACTAATSITFLSVAAEGADTDQVYPPAPPSSFDKLMTVTV
jgi:hypothetical protein